MDTFAPRLTAVLKGINLTPEAASKRVGFDVVPLTFGTRPPTAFELVALLNAVGLPHGTLLDGVVIPNGASPEVAWMFASAEHLRAAKAERDRAVIARDFATAERDKALAELKLLKEAPVETT